MGCKHRGPITMSGVIRTMDEFSDPTPIATVEQFKTALLAVATNSGTLRQQLAILRAHCRALSIPSPHKTGRCGRFQFIQCHQQPVWAFCPLRRRCTRHRPGPFSDGIPTGGARWRFGNDGAPLTENGHYEWIMRPELVQALKEMRWA